MSAPSPDRTLSRMTSHDDVGDRLTRSALSGERGASTAAFRRELEAARERIYTRAERVPLRDLDRWVADPDSGTIRHDTGKFFNILGLDVDLAGAPVPRWQQPIIEQPEVGILGILLKEFDGVLHALMQLKAEPGNHNGLQVSPTVQATRSNYMRVHGGHPTPYLDYFRDRDRHRVVVDVRQSEQGSWFLRKRNRNMAIETTEPVEVLDGFHWLTLAQLNELLAVDDLINMDARSVLACLPLTGLPGEGRPPGPRRTTPDRDGTGALLSWLSERRASTAIEVERVPLDRMDGWRWDGDTISHVSSRFFDVIGVRVEAGGREVGRWDQPMIAARGTGLVAFLVTHLDGELHVLVSARVEPGFVDVAELGPSVQCIPDTYRHLLRSSWPPFLEHVLRADPGRIRFDAIQSEEGGRFYHTRTRHVIVETDEPLAHPDYRWVTPAQLGELLRHSHYLNVQARSLLACLRTLTGSPAQHWLRADRRAA
jgi:oxidase EvaA